MCEAWGRAFAQVGYLKRHVKFHTREKPHECESSPKSHMRIQRGTGGQTPPPLENHKNIGVLSNTGLDPLKNDKATNLAFNVGPSSARQRNAI